MDETLPPPPTPPKPTSRVSLEVDTGPSGDPRPPGMPPKWILVLGGKKVAIALSGLVAAVVVAGLTLLAAKLRLPIPSEFWVTTEISIAGMISAFLLGQGYADGKTGGTTSSAIQAIKASDLADRFNRL